MADLPAQATASALTRRQVQGLAVLSSGLVALALRGYVPDDVRVGREAGELLLAGHLDVFQQMPEAQMGPMSLVVAAIVPRPGYVAVVVLLLAVLFRALPATGRTGRMVVVPVLCLCLPWSLYGIEGHFDDAGVAVGAAWCVYAARRGDAKLIGAAWCLALVCKPTALVLWPLVWWTSKRASAWSVLAAGLVWLPFVLVDVGGFLQAGRGIAVVWPHSLPDLLGAADGQTFPPWVRPAQLLGGLALCWLLARRGRPAAAVVAVVAWRALLEPSALPSYSTAVIAAAVVYDLCRDRPWLGAAPPWWRALPLCTLVATSSWVVSRFYPLSMTLGLARLAGLCAVLLLALVGSTSRSRATPSDPPVAGRDGLGGRRATVTHT